MGDRHPAILPYAPPGTRIGRTTRSVSYEQGAGGPTITIPPASLWRLAARGLLGWSVAALAALLASLVLSDNLGPLKNPVNVAIEWAVVLVAMLFLARRTLVLVRTLWLGRRAAVIRVTAGELAVESPALAGRKTFRWSRDGVMDLEVIPGGPTPAVLPAIELRVCGRMSGPKRVPIPWPRHEPAVGLEQLLCEALNLPARAELNGRDPDA